MLVTEAETCRSGNPRFERVRERGTDFDFNLPLRTALACMSETMILAMEGRFEPYTLGAASNWQRSSRSPAMAERCGFELADMRAFDAAITPEKLAATREAVMVLETTIAYRALTMSFDRLRIYTIGPHGTRVQVMKRVVSVPPGIERARPSRGGELLGEGEADAVRLLGAARP